MLAPTIIKSILTLYCTVKGLMIKAYGKWEISGQDWP
nr:MAG TPA: hypothetical protein [Caudoviricetes sp.]